jgi:hypothetical protein
MMAIIQIRGVLVNMLVEIAPDVYKDFVTTDKKGTKQLIVKCMNAIYDTMVASLLYYRKFSKSLTDNGFEFNPYDPCVANKMIGGQPSDDSYLLPCRLLLQVEPQESASNG